MNTPQPFTDMSNRAAVPTLCPVCGRAVLERGLPAGYSGEYCLCAAPPVRAEPAGEAS